MARACLALLTWALSAEVAAAQVAVESAASVHVEVTVDVTATARIDAGAAAAPVEPAVLVVPPSESSPALTPLLRARGEMAFLDGDYAFAAWGGSVLLGADSGAGWSGGLVVSYLAEIGGDPSEIDLALEAQKDFSPESELGLVLVARLGTAFMLGLEPRGELDSGIRMVGQLGIGTRVSFDPRVALTLDLRGLLRYAPGAGADVTLVGGAAFTMGLALRVD